MLTFASTVGLTDIITVLCQVLLSSFSALPILVTDVTLSDCSIAMILLYVWMVWLSNQWEINITITYQNTNNKIKDFKKSWFGANYLTMMKLL